MSITNKETGFITWEGEPIYDGDKLETNNNQQGTVSWIDDEYWGLVIKNGENEVLGEDDNTIIPLEMGLNLSSKRGHTLFHKVVPEKDGNFTSISKNSRLRQRVALLADTIGARLEVDSSELTYADILNFLMKQNVYVTVIPTIITSYANPIFNCFRNYEYTIITLRKTYQSEENDGFDTWEDAMEAGISKAVDAIAHEEIKRVCDEHLK